VTVTETAPAAEKTTGWNDWNNNGNGHKSW
jgi:hypothetical protein